MLFAVFLVFVADEKAIKEVWCNKGASVFRLCPICWKVCSHKTSRAKSAGQILDTCTDVAQLRECSHSDTSVREALDEVRSVEATDLANRAAGAAGLLTPLLAGLWVGQAVRS